MSRFALRKRKHKNRSQDQSSGADSNFLELPLNPKTQSSADRQERLKAQVKSLKVPGKKAKRLEKYLETKSKNDETRQLIEKLAISKVDTKALRSSKRIGQGSNAGNSLEKAFLTDKSYLLRTAPGAGLKRPLTVDGAGKPVITKRRKMTSDLQNAIEGPDFEGFSSVSESQEDESHAEPVNTLKRTSAFKAWATHSRNEALGYTLPSPATFLPESSKNYSKPGTIVLEDEYSPTPKIRAAPVARMPFNVPIARNANMNEFRLSLPVVAEEQRIMESINNNDCSIIYGATGSGKTTQIPQFLLEAGYGNANSANPGMIGVTQPRRVAAVSMAQRVKAELGSDFEEMVSHQIRFESSLSEKTAIKFMTDGVLLREITRDFKLTKYSAIIIDEAHERTINTDLLIGMLSRIVETRSALNKRNSACTRLKLVIMSATLRITDYTRNPFLFRSGIPPVVEIEGRQFDVTIHFARKTRHDYVDEMFEKVTRGHRKLPLGGFLVFLTGENEIKILERKLRGVFQSTSTYKSIPRVRVSAADESLEIEDIGINNPQNREPEIQSDDEINIRGTDDAEYEDDYLDDEERLETILKIHVLPLYSQLPSEEQMRVFEPIPDGSRLIVLATNVAETSITIPGIKYVFDCGRSKEKKYNRSKGVQSFEIGWISKASAEQRAGRAGRIGSGHCYRLFSSAIYDRDFVDFAEPEILRTPAEGIVLTLRSMGISNIQAFPFPTAPEPDSLAKAEYLLEILGALNKGEVTEIGKQLAMYPLSPRLSRILYVGQHQNLLAYTIALVAALSAPEIFVPKALLDFRHHSDDLTATIPENEILAREDRRRLHSEFIAQISALDKTCDVLKLLTLFCVSFKSYRDSHGTIKQFLRPKAFDEACRLRLQLTSISRSVNPSTEQFIQCLTEPSKSEVRILRQIISAGYIDHVAIRADQLSDFSYNIIGPQRATNTPYLSLFPLDDREEDFQAPESGTGRPTSVKHVYIHPSSLLANLPPGKLPKFVIYSHLSSSRPRKMSEKIGSDCSALRTIKMHPLTPITARQIVALAFGTPLLEEGKPIGKIETLPRENSTERRICWILYSLKGETGMMPWPLPPARKVVQRRNSKNGWVVERILN